MGNLNRGPKKVLVNTLTNKNFGMYTNSAGTRILVYKNTGLAIPYESTFGAPEVMAGYGDVENMETVLLNLFAPYPSETVNWVAELNIKAIPMRNSDVRTHRELTRNYSGLVESLAIASGVEVADADKLTAIKQIVQGINHDDRRFCDATMVYAVTNDDTSDNSTVVITLENGLTKTLTAATTASLAAAINADTDLNPYMTAYEATANSGAVVSNCVIEGTSPVFFLVEDGTDTTVQGFWIKLTQTETNVNLSYGGGLTTTKWEKTPFVKIELDGSSIANDNTDDADITLTIDGTDYAINTSGANRDAKLLSTAALLCVNGLGPDSIFIAAIDIPASDVVNVVAIGEAMTIANTAAGDVYVITPEDLEYSQATLDAKAMSQIFPNLPGNEFQVIDLPDPNSRYFKLKIKWNMEGDDNVVFDAMNVRKGDVEFYIKESLMPTLLADTTKDYWVNGTNMMTDDATGANRHFAELINIWTGASTITDAILSK